MRKTIPNMLKSMHASAIAAKAIGTFFVLAAIESSAQSQSAHVHGLATLRLAIDAETLEIEFESPAANLLGFEHRARSASDIALVKKTSSILQAGNELFLFNGANCKLDNVDLDLSDVQANGEHNHDPHNKENMHAERSHKEHPHEEYSHEEHDHKKHHEDRDHQEHDHDEHEDHHEGHDHADEEHEESHSEINASYRFGCASTDSLISITINLTDHFPAIEKINAMWVTEAGQGAENISATNKTLKLN